MTECVEWECSRRVVLAIVHRVAGSQLCFTDWIIKTRFIALFRLRFIASGLVVSIRFCGGRWPRGQTFQQKRNYKLNGITTSMELWDWWNYSLDRIMTGITSSTELRPQRNQNLGGIMTSTKLRPQRNCDLNRITTLTELWPLLSSN